MEFVVPKVSLASDAPILTASDAGRASVRIIYALTAGQNQHESAALQLSNFFSCGGHLVLEDKDRPVEYPISFLAHRSEVTPIHLCRLGSFGGVQRVLGSRHPAGIQPVVNKDGTCTSPPLTEYAARPLYPLLNRPEALIEAYDMAYELAHRDGRTMVTSRDTIAVMRQVMPPIPDGPFQAVKMLKRVYRILSAFPQYRQVCSTLSDVIDEAERLVP